jgi:lysophospholipase L1-like esterase
VGAVSSNGAATIWSPVQHFTIASSALPRSAATKQLNPAATPTPRFSLSGWAQAHENLVTLAKGGEADIVFLGDSITAGWAQQKAWDESLRPLGAVNFGIAGDSTEQVLWRIQHGELDPIRPRAFVLLIGTNNLVAHSAAQIAEGITAIVRTLGEKVPDARILLMGLLPRGDALPASAVSKIEDINRVISNLDNGDTVKYLDIGPKLLVDGKISRELMPDFLHLSARGYQVWADAVLPLLRDL